MPPHEIEPILARIPELAGRLDQLRITPLAGGMTNRNVKIESDSDAFVLRMAGKNTALLGIQRLCEAACTRAAASVGVGPEVIAYLPDQGVPKAVNLLLCTGSSPPCFAIMAARKDREVFARFGPCATIMR